MSVRLDDITSLNLLTAPVTITSAFVRSVYGGVAAVVGFVAGDPRKCWALLATVASLYVVLVVPPTPLLPLSEFLHHHGTFMLYWTALGVLSSVGLGSGLHTFLLFLGPHIVRVANAASECNHVNFTAEIESYWASRPVYTHDAWACGPIGKTPPGFWEVVGKVQWACFLWGLGTAMGELPPYFVARKARLTGKQLDELREVDDAEHNPNPGLLDRAKIMVHEGVHRFGFWAILVAASIPNPLFDLAGLTCGHFLVPFWTFFGATFVGKAIVKVHIQALFYIVMFNISTIEKIESLLPDNLHPYIGTYLKRPILSSQFGACFDKVASDGIDACQACCTEMFRRHGDGLSEDCSSECSTAEHNASWMAQAWSMLVTLFILGFVVSIVHDTARHQLAMDALKDVQRTDGPATSPVMISDQQTGRSRGRNRSRSHSRATRSSDTARAVEVPQRRRSKSRVPRYRSRTPTRRTR